MQARNSSVTCPAPGGDDRLHGTPYMLHMPLSLSLLFALKHTQRTCESGAVAVLVTQTHSYHLLLHHQSNTVIHRKRLHPALRHDVDEE